jgi:hypothetical protein
MHSLEINNLLGYELSATDEGCDTQIPDVGHLLFIYITTSRASIDVNLGAQHKLLLNTPITATNIVSTLRELAMNILILAYCEKVTMNDVRAIRLITDYVNGLGGNVDEMYPPHPRFKYHVSMISRMYVAMLKETIESVEMNII